MSVIHQEREVGFDPRLLVFPGVLVLVLFGFLVRLWYLQVVQAPVLMAEAARYRTVKIESLAPRGIIVDRNGALLAGVRPEVVISAVPRLVRQHPESLRAVAELTQTPLERLERKVNDGAWQQDFPTPIVIGVPIEVASRIAERPDAYPGIQVSTQPMRFYADPLSLAHVLGYVWTPNEKDVERLDGLGLDTPDYVGKRGLEYVYEADLMGTPGTEEVQVNARRQPLRTVSIEPAVPGDRLRLSLDLDLQSFGQKLLEGRRGAIVALDPKTGGVLAMVSAPTYNAHDFVRGISVSDYRRLSEDKASPLHNRAIGSRYAPGSTFKVVNAIAMAEHGLYSPQRRVYCSGGLKVGNRFFRCLGHHGSIGFHEAMVKSCNAYFMQTALDMKIDNLTQTCAHLHITGRTGVDCQGEAASVVPTREYIEDRLEGRWYPGNTANIGIGQGEVNLTPIQMAHVAAVVANNGVGYRPRLATSTRLFGSATEVPIEPELYTQIEASPQFWAALRSSMVDVIERGTAGRARIPAFQWAGKTGSAENPQSDEAHSWFIGFAPAQNPRIAIAVVVENAGHGGEIAAPMASQMVRRYLRNLEGAQIQVQGEAANAAARSATSSARVGSPNSR